MTQLYTPPGCTTLDKLGEAQIRIGIQGPPFSGKTTASLTFPNPVCVSYDRKTSAHSHRSDVILVPFYDVAFIERICKRPGIQAPVQRKDALLKWLSTEGVRLSKDQTLVADGSTAIEEEYHIWFRYNENELAVTAKGYKNEFVEWRMKNDYFGELFMAFRAIPGHVIYICHETEARDKEGKLNGKIRPLLTGQTGDKLAGNFTDWFRAHTISKPQSEDQASKLKKWAGIDDSVLKEWVQSTPEIHQTIYLWQTQADELADCGTTSLFNAPKYVIAHYQTFERYRRKQATITQQ